eukprot:5274184-Alexandrium_andersonii.AAC.1
MGDSIDPLTTIPGWAITLHRGDPMRLIFLGFGLFALASCIMDLVNRGLWAGQSLAIKLRNAWLEMK